MFWNCDKAILSVGHVRTSSLTKLRKWQKETNPSEMHFLTSHPQKECMHWIFHTGPSIFQENTTCTKKNEASNLWRCAGGYSVCRILMKLFIAIVKEKKHLHRWRNFWNPIPRDVFRGTFDPQERLKRCCGWMERGWINAGASALALFSLPHKRSH